MCRRQVLLSWPLKNGCWFGSSDGFCGEQIMSVTDASFADLSVYLQNVQVSCLQMSYRNILFKPTKVCEIQKYKQRFLKTHLLRKKTKDESHKLFATTQENDLAYVLKPVPLQNVSNANHLHDILLCIPWTVAKRRQVSHGDPLDNPLWATTQRERGGALQNTTSEKSTAEACQSEEKELPDAHGIWEGLFI